MTYVNQDSRPMPGVTRTQPPPLKTKRKEERFVSMAMTNFVEPSIVRLYKVKRPLQSVSSVLFCPSSTSEALQMSEGLLVADPEAGKIVKFDALNGRYSCDLLRDVDARAMCKLGPDCLALVDGNEWGSCVKIVSADTGLVLTTWGRQLNTWTPSAVATTRDGHLVVSNIHPDASSRLTLFAADGRQISHFGRAVGPGDLVFPSPLSVASDMTSGRIFVADADTGCVKVFDTRGSYVTEFGKDSSTGSSANTSAMLDRPVSVCCDSLGNTVVCDKEGQRVLLFSPDGRHLCNLIDFRPATGSSSKWQAKRQQNRHGKLDPVCVGLSSPGSRIAVVLNDNSVKTRCFRKLIVCSVKPEL